MAKRSASKGLLVNPRTIPNESEARRTKWLADATSGFICPQPSNRALYAIILHRLWPEGHGIPGPHVTRDELRAAINATYTTKHGGDYKDVFRRVRELQGEEGFTCIIQEGTKYQLQSLSVSAKREPRAKLPATEWRRLKEAYGHKCACCGKQEPDVQLSPDHKVPRNRGGSQEFGNWQPLCEQCNNIKSNACRGCDLNCNVCSWAFPNEYKLIVIADDNKELARRGAEKLKVSQSDLVNRVLRDYFNRNKV